MKTHEHTGRSQTSQDVARGSMQRRVRAHGSMVGKPKRLELRFVTYSEGDRLVREGWTLAKEEDANRAFGMVYLERLETPNE